MISTPRAPRLPALHADLIYENLEYGTSSAKMSPNSLTGARNIYQDFLETFSQTFSSDKVVLTVTPSVDTFPMLWKTEMTIECAWIPTKHSSGLDLVVDRVSVFINGIYNTELGEGMRPGTIKVIFDICRVLKFCKCLNMLIHLTLIN